MTYNDITSILAKYKYRYSKLVDMDNIIQEIHVEECSLSALDHQQQLRNLFPEYNVDYMPNLQYILIKRKL